MPHFLLTFGDAMRPPVGAVIIEAPPNKMATRLTPPIWRVLDFSSA
jgi:hypothetical protein